MRFEYIKNDTVHIIKGIVLKSDNSPNKLCLVVLKNLDLNSEVARTNTDNFGKYYIEFDINSLVPAVYELKLFGTGDNENTFNFEIVDTSGSPSATISSSNGLIFKLTSSYTPSSTVLSITTNNIINPTFAWYKNNVLINGAVSTSYTIDDISTIFTENQVVVFKCIINGVDEFNNAISPIQLNISLAKIVDGSAGVGIIYRGIYDTSKQYYKTDKRGDVVKYNNVYYLCKLTTSNPAGAWTGATNWEEFGEQFSSVATAILLAEDAVITQTLTIGELGTSGGVIKSAGSVDLDTGTGFYLGLINTDPISGVFKVGNDSQFLKWNGTNLRIKSSHFDLTTTGKLWAEQGGFGGSAETPKVLIDENGLKTGNTSLHGNNSWNTPTVSSPLNGSNLGVNYAKSALVTLTNEIFNIQYYETEDQSITSPEIIVLEEDIGKIFTWAPKVSATTEAGKHYFEIRVYLNNWVTPVLTKTFSRSVGSPEIPALVNYVPTASCSLKFQLVYTNVIEGTSELPPL